jgi:phage shock protein C
MNAKKRLRLSRNRMLWGVCGGLAEYYGVEPLFVRLFFFLTAAASVFVPGIIIYLVLWMLMPPPE